jgi:hypothetical protein
MPTQQQQRSAKDHINQLLSALGDREIETVEKFVEFVYLGGGTDTIETAPLDDEPYTEQQQRRDADRCAALDRGEGIPHEEILKEFGLS